MLDVNGFIRAGVGAASSQIASHITRYVTTSCIGWLIELIPFAWVLG